MSNISHNSPKPAQSVVNSDELSVEEYRLWVDALVLRAESLEKARQHAPGKILRRSSLQTIAYDAEKKEA